MSLKTDFSEWFPVNGRTTITNDEDTLSRSIYSVIESSQKVFS